MCTIRQEPEHLTALLKSIEGAVIRGRELDLQRRADAASHQDDLLDISSLKMMLHHTTSGVSVGECNETGIPDRLKEFQGVLERAVAAP
jgi:hypothetical protein